jgi:hypothetical protein
MALGLMIVGENPGKTGTMLGKLLSSNLLCATFSRD